MRIRIVYDPSGPRGLWRSRVENAETGEVIQGVRAVRFSHEAGDIPLITLDFVKDVSVEIVADGELEDVTQVDDHFKRMRLAQEKR